MDCNTCSSLRLHHGNEIFISVNGNVISYYGSSFASNLPPFYGPNVESNRS